MIRDMDIRDRLEWHKDMLMGRDISHGFFIRSPILPDCAPDSLTFQDPAEWVTSMELKGIQSS